jgi:hypothetical protein
VQWFGRVLHGKWADASLEKKKEQARKGYAASNSNFKMILNSYVLQQAPKTNPSLKENGPHGH